MKSQLLLWIITFLACTCTTQTEQFDIDVSACDAPPVPRGDGLRCYRVIDPGTPAARDAARAACRTIRGRLASAGSAATDAAVLRVVSERRLSEAWLGATENVGAWAWINDGGDVSVQGCHADDPRDPDMPTVTTISDMRPEKCVEHCRQEQYKYAGVQNGTLCYCGDAFGRHGTSDQCTMQCPVGLAETCGGNHSSAVYAVDGSASNWLVTNPNNHLGYQNCAVLEASPGVDLLWNDVKCAEAHRPLCSINITEAECSAHSAPYKTHVLGAGCFAVLDASASWWLSRVACREAGGDLAALPDPATRAAVEAYVRQSVSPDLGDSYNLWLGLTKSMWRWETGEEVLYTNWLVDKPNSPTQRCLAVVAPPGTAAWDDVDCSGARSVICEIDNSTAGRLPPLPATSPASTEGDQTVTATVGEAVTGTSARSPSTTTPPDNGGNGLLVTDEQLAIIVGVIAGSLCVAIITAGIYCFSERYIKAKRQRKEETKEIEELDTKSLDTMSYHSAYFYEMGKEEEEGKKGKDTSVPEIHPAPPDVIPAPDT